MVFLGLQKWPDGRGVPNYGLVQTDKMIPWLRFHSSCSTVTETSTVLEDRPVCRTERVESCLTDSSCRQIKVNRCHIERVKVRKGRPVTKCERIPRQLCAQVSTEI